MNNQVTRRGLSPQQAEDIVYAAYDKDDTAKLLGNLISSGSALTAWAYEEKAGYTVHISSSYFSLKT